MLLLSLLNYEPYSTKAWDEEGFLKSCSSQRCSKHGPDIRFPFRLSTHDPSCGMPGMQLSCSGHDTILDHPVLGSCKVTAIYYRYRVINAILLVESSSNCPLQKLASTNVSTAVYEPQKKDGATIVGCSKDSIAINQDGIVGPRSCLNLSSHGSQLWYLVPPRTYMSALPPDCTVVAKGIPIPYNYDRNGPNENQYLDISNLKEKANKVINFGETAFTWHLNKITNACQGCERNGHHCGFSSQRGQAFCQHQGILHLIFFFHKGILQVISSIYCINNYVMEFIIIKLFLNNSYRIFT